MRVEKLLPWLTHKAVAAPPRAETLRAEAMRHAPGGSVWRQSSERSEAALDSFLEPIEPANFGSPRYGPPNPGFPDLIRPSFVQWSRPTIAAESPLLRERC
jgi:hypothetical protein